MTQKKRFFYNRLKQERSWCNMRKKKKQDNRLYCPYCGRQAVLRPATYVYGERNLDPENYLYVCGGYPACDSYIGVHKKSLRPMGTLADGNLRHKRIEAHRALNEVINAGVMTKHGLYIWLQNRLCLSETEMHIGKFSYFRCEETIRECKKLMAQNKIKIESFSYEENKFAA